MDEEKVKTEDRWRASLQYYCPIMDISITRLYLAPIPQLQPFPPPMHYYMFFFVIDHFFFHDTVELINSNYIYIYIFFLSTLFIIQCHPPIHGVTLHCHCTYSQILATHRSSSLVWKWPWLLLQSLTVGRCPSDSWRCLTSSTPGFSSSGLFLAASPSQRQVKKKMERKKKSVASRPKTRGAAQHHIQATSAPPQSSILALQESTVPVSVTTPKVLTIAPPPRLGGGGHHLRGLRVASKLKSAHKLTCRWHVARGEVHEQGIEHPLLIFTGKRMMRIITQKKQELCRIWKTYASSLGHLCKSGP